MNILYWNGFICNGGKEKMLHTGYNMDVELHVNEHWFDENFKQSNGLRSTF